MIIHSLAVHIVYTTIYCPNKKLMNHFEMKKLDRQMHISLRFSVVSRASAMFTFGKYLSHQFSSSPLKPFIYSTRVQSIFASWFVTCIYSLSRCQSKCGWTRACPPPRTPSISPFNSISYSFRCALVQNYDKGILLGLKIGHPLCRYQCDRQLITFYPGVPTACAAAIRTVIGMYNNNTYYINIIQIIVCVYEAQPFWLCAPFPIHSAGENACFRFAYHSIS